MPASTSSFSLLIIEVEELCQGKIFVKTRWIGMAQRDEEVVDKKDVVVID
jgi:hypothetical protein